MIKDYNKIECTDIEKSIILNIHNLEKRSMILEQGLYGLVSLCSLGGLIATVLYINKIISASGTYEYISLIFSDIQALTYWRELLLSVADSLPFLGLAMLFGVGALFLWSILKTFKIQIFKGALV